MSSVVTLPIGTVFDGEYRTTWRYQDNQKPQAFEHVFESLVKRAKIGPLTIHVTDAARGTGMFVVLDGHVCLDVYRSLGRENVAVVYHPNLSTEEALAFYISANYLRSEGWLRSGVKLRDLLAKLGDKSTLLMADPDLAKDLVNRSQVKWDEYSTVFVDPNESQNHEDALFG